jgi:zeaxanthin glucosyltransferase
MKTVVLLIYHGQGHFNATFRIASILEKQFNVVFAGHEFFKANVHQQGFKFYSLQSVPFALGFERWINAKKKKNYLYWASLIDRIRDTVYYEREKELAKVVSDLNPSFILIDSWQSTDIIVLYPLLREKHIRVGFIQTMLPHDTTGIQNYFKRLRQKIRYIGFDNNFILKRRVDKNSFPLKYISKTRYSFSPSFERIHELVLAPKEFNNHPNQNPYRTYVGFMPFSGRAEHASTEFTKQFSNLLSTGFPLIYCSFGTLNYDDRVRLNAFVQRIISALKNEDFVLIISGESVDAIENPPANVTVFRNAPQLKVLQHASAFISHGGLNSIKEAIYAEVPMLVYPLTADTDQRLNSSRVADHEVGLTGSLKNDSADSILQKIKALLSNNIYKTNLRKLKQIDQAYSKAIFLESFNKLEQFPDA